MAKTVNIRKFPKAGTIGHIVLTALAKNPDLKTEDILPAVLKASPESAFKASHLAWYKHQVRSGGYILPVDEKKKDKAKRSKVNSKKAKSKPAKGKGKVEKATVAK